MTLDDPKLTAYALGELSSEAADAGIAADRLEVESFLAQNAEARAFVQETRALANLTATALALELSPGLDADRRDQLLTTADEDNRSLTRSLRLSAAGANKRTDVYHVITHPTPLPRRYRRYNWIAAAAAVLIVASILTAVLSGLFKGPIGQMAGMNAKPTNPNATPTSNGARPTGIAQGTAIPAPDDEATTNPAPRTIVAMPWDSDDQHRSSLPFGYGNSIFVAPLNGPTTRESGGAGPAVAGAYAVTIENSFQDVSHAPLSSFAFNVGKGSFDAVRQALTTNRLPDRNSVRIEELLNAFPYHYAAPSNGDDFASNIEIASCPWQPTHRLVRIGLKARDVSDREVIAKDLSIGVEFNPSLVSAYRLIGYDRRVLTRPERDADPHRNDVHGGQSVTALYEVIPAEGSALFNFEDELKYQKPRELTDAARSREYLTVKLAYADPKFDTAKTMEFTAQDRGTSVRQATADFRFAAAIASFAMVLRDSPNRGDATLDSALALAQGSLTLTPDEEADDRTQLIDLIHQARALRA